MRGIRIARFSELYLFIFQQIQLVMVLLGGGSRGKENPARKPGLECITLVRWGIYLSIALLKCAHFLQPLGMKFQQLILWLQHSKTQEAHQ